ncbi:hypothetical protein Sant_1584 [Sodalis praecaptivus]|uniref:YCII-related domain-containing protein n=1 Tax=Sodalis praecaptivus TaxID=1239307 RepID=W0HVU8_9GAMM|nr:YciI family protein [Sodalis praecaptivus]AHF76642.1 hypothetical protein Sant_1584 [Sodalis praecaptivus]
MRRTADMGLYLVRMDHPHGEGWAQFVVEHVQYLKTLIDQGTLLASGPLQGTPLRAGFLIIMADSQQQVEALVAADPFSREGLICQLRIEQWDPLFGEWANRSSQTLPPALASLLD